MDDDGMLMLNISSSNAKRQDQKVVTKFSKEPKPVVDDKKQSHKHSRANRNRATDQEHGKKNNVTSCLFTRNPDVPDLSDYIGEKKDNTGQQTALFSGDSFKDLPIAKELVANIKSSLLSEKLTTVQKLAIPPLLEGKDVLVKSATGSGKTLSYAIPIVEKLRSRKPRISRADGPYAIILSPTRELALQSFEVLQGLCGSGVWVVPGIIVGGEKKKSEKARIRKGINILLGTPGRLLDHMKTTQSLNLSHVETLVLDEADRLLDMGFKETLTSIVDMINDKSSVHRQNVLLSATLDPRVHDLASVCSENHVFIDATACDDSSGNTTVEATDDSERALNAPSTLQQYFMVVPAKQRLVALHSFLSKVLSTGSAMKLIVFASSRALVDFIYDCLKEILFATTAESNVALYQLHGSMLQSKRQEALNGMRKDTRSLLICTDVAARGLDLPNVNWIVQYNPASDVDEYLHRVGRTARIGQKGESLLFLLPSEVQYLSLLKKKKAFIDEMKVETLFKAVATKRGKRLNQADVENAISSIQEEYEEHVLSSNVHKELANAAFASFIQAYTAYPSNMKSIFHIKKLHLGHIAKSCGLRETPTVVTKQNAPRKQDKGKKESKSTMSLKRFSKQMVSEHDSSTDTSGPVPKKQRKKFK